MDLGGCLIQQISPLHFSWFSGADEEYLFPLLFRLSSNCNRTVPISQWVNETQSPRWGGWKRAMKHHWPVATKFKSHHRAKNFPMQRAGWREWRRLGWWAGSHGCSSRNLGLSFPLSEPCLLYLARLKKAAAHNGEHRSRKKTNDANAFHDEVQTQLGWTDEISGWAASRYCSTAR